RGRAAAPKDGPRSAESLVACSRLIVEGRVERVDPVPGTDQDRITLRVTHTYKPRSGGAPTVTFPVDQGLAPGAAVGDRPLVSIPEGAQEPDTWALGAERTRLRTRIVTALPRAADLPCNAGQDG
ncbi:hypothetical protein GTW43_34745, partial [Streptomyces sp. SID5785]|nr:hypothetical protein [Streptomyces sp. SID5785]